MGGPLPIPGSEIIAYAQIHGFMPDIKFFYRCITAMDLEYFKHEAEKKKSEKPAKPQKTGGPRPPRRRK